MVRLVDRAQMLTTTSGTADLVLAVAAAGYQSFTAAGVQVGDTVRYVIEQDTQWEIGTGVFDGTNLTRSVIQSSAGGNKIELDGQGAVVYVTAAAQDIAQLNSDVQFTSVQLTGGTGDQGTISWNVDEETLDIIQNGAVLQVGQETHVHARNDTGTLIPNGTAVMATGTLGASGRITVAPMIADGSIPARFFIGLTTEDIDPGTDGKVTTFGKISHVNTAAFPEGSVLWLDPSVPGGLTLTEPEAPNLKIATAFVISSKNNGTLMVRANSGHRLADAHDVEVSTAADGDSLAWDATAFRWTTKKMSSADLSDIDNTGRTTGSVLVYSSTSSKYEATTVLSEQTIQGGNY